MRTWDARRMGPGMISRDLLRPETPDPATWALDEPLLRVGGACMYCILDDDDCCVEGSWIALRPDCLTGERRLEGDMVRSGVQMETTEVLRLCCSTSSCNWSSGGGCCCCLKLAVTVELQGMMAGGSGEAAVIIVAGGEEGADFEANNFCCEEDVTPAELELFLLLVTLLLVDWCLCWDWAIFLTSVDSQEDVEVLSSPGDEENKFVICKDISFEADSILFFSSLCKQYYWSLLSFDLNIWN